MDFRRHMTMINKVSAEMLFGIIFFASILQSGCTHQKTVPSDQPNIVWLVTEDNSIHFSRLYESTGALMPNIASLAKRGVIFNRAFSNAPVCSVARSTLISGCYGPRVGTQYHRKMKKVPMPEGLEMFPAYLRQGGYYTTNCSKEDYNFIKPDNVWDESSNKATYKNRKPGQPFFSCAKLWDHS